MADEERELLLRIRAEGMAQVEAINRALDRTTRATRASTQATRESNKATLRQGQGLSTLMNQQSRLGQFFAGNTRSARLFSDAMGLMAGNILRLGVTMGAFVIAGRAINRMIRQLIGGFAGLLTISKQFETAQLQFTAFLGSAEAATRRVREAMEFSFKTPFNMDAVIEASTILEGFSLGAQRWLTLAGDAAAAFNVEIRDMALALGQARLGEFERLKRFGISRAVIEQRVGRKLRGGTPEEMAILWENTISLIEERTQGMMVLFQQSWKGIVSNMVGEWQRFQLQIGEAGAFDAWKMAAQTALSGMQNLTSQGGEAKQVAFGIADAMMEVARWSAMATAQLTDWLPIFLRATSAQRNTIKAFTEQDPAAAWEAMKDIIIFLDQSLDHLAATSTNVTEEMLQGMTFNFETFQANVDALVKEGVARSTAVNVVMTKTFGIIRENRAATAELSAATDQADASWKTATETVDAFTAALEKLREQQAQQLINSQAQVAFLLEVDSAAEQQIITWRELAKSLKEFNDEQARMAIMREDPRMFPVLFPKKFEEAQKPIKDPLGGKDPLGEGAETELDNRITRAEQFWTRMVDTQTIGLEALSAGIDTTLFMMADSWELFFRKQISLTEGWSMMVDSLMRGVGAMWIDVVADIMAAEAKKFAGLAIGAKALALISINPMAAAWKLGAAAIGLGIGSAILKGMSASMVSGSQIATFDPDRDGGTTAAGAGRGRGVQRRGFISMRGAAPITYNIVINTYFNAPVMAMNPQEFGDKTLRPIVEDTLYRAGVA